MTSDGIDVRKVREMAEALRAPTILGHSGVLLPEEVGLVGSATAEALRATGVFGIFGPVKMQIDGGETIDAWVAPRWTILLLEAIAAVGMDGYGARVPFLRGDADFQAFFKRFVFECADDIPPAFWPARLFAWVMTSADRARAIGSVTGVLLERAPLLHGSWLGEWREKVAALLTAEWEAEVSAP